MKTFNSESERLMFVQTQTTNLIELLEGNPFQKYMTGKLWSVYYELDRQLINLRYADKVQ